MTVLMVHGAFTSHRFWLHFTNGTRQAEWRTFSAQRGSTSGSLICAITAIARANRGVEPGRSRTGCFTTPVRRTLAAATMAVSRALGRFPARRLRFGNEDGAAEVIAEWREWNVRGRWVGTDGFDYFAGLGALSTPYLGAWLRETL
jgi:hypothetical protein